MRANRSAACRPPSALAATTESTRCSSSSLPARMTGRAHAHARLGRLQRHRPGRDHDGVRSVVNRLVDAPRCLVLLACGGHDQTAPGIGKGLGQTLEKPGIEGVVHRPGDKSDCVRLLANEASCRRRRPIAQLLGNPKNPRLLRCLHAAARECPGDGGHRHARMAGNVLDCGALHFEGTAFGGKNANVTNIQRYPRMWSSSDGKPPLILHGTRYCQVVAFWSRLGNGNVCNHTPRPPRERAS